jgi:N-acetylglucosaminyl-diphospho-decaprenol L-rhamnosyltransferase
MRKSFGRNTNSDPRVPVTIIVLVYNTLDLLLQCLQSFFEACRTQGWQIIVVDNGSEEDVRSAIDGKFRGVEVIRSERNLGFAAGNNLGLRNAKGEFVILMNSDVIAGPETLEDLVSSLKQEPQAGAMSPGLLTARGEPQAFAFGSDPSPGYLIKRGMRFLLGLGSFHDWAMQKSLDVDWVSAACICVRAIVIQGVGGLDDRFPLYFEDADWCMRMRSAGWKVIYNPQLRVIHLGGSSKPRGSAGRRDLYYQSLLLFCGKHYGRCWNLILRILLTVYRLLTTIRSLFPKRF